MSKTTTISAIQTHEGKALECFGVSQNEEDGGVTFMRWVQTPYPELATPPELFEISEKEWHDLREEVGARVCPKTEESAIVKGLGRVTDALYELRNEAREVRGAIDLLRRPPEQVAK